MKYNSVFDNYLVPSISDVFVNWTSNDGYNSIDDIYNTVWNRRCKAIEQRLKSKGLKANVWRHDLFKVDYYVVNLDEESSNFYSKDIKNIAEALDIPNVWVDFVGRRKYFIKEKELNDKYLNDCGEMVFDQDLDFFEMYNDYDEFNFEMFLKDAINLKDDLVKKVSYNKSAELLTIQCKHADMVVTRLRELNLHLEDYVYTQVKLRDVPYSVIVINMEEVIYGD